MRPLAAAAPLAPPAGTGRLAGAPADEVVVLVDAADRELGTAAKLAVHRDGRLHRAVSVFVFDDAGRWLLQRRADGKYHSAGLWSNAACTHPRPGEAPAAAALRRLREEMGVQCALAPAFAFVYRAELPDGPEPLVEHEYDHVFVGRYGGAAAPAPDEVAAWRWVDAGALADEMAAAPERFTAWFRIVEGRVRAHVGGVPGGAL